MTLEIKVSKKLVPYKTAFEQLRKRVDCIKNHKSNDLLWILEHPLTYTYGIRSKENEVLDKNIKHILEAKRTFFQEMDEKYNAYRLILCLIDSKCKSIFYKGNN